MIDPLFIYLLNIIPMIRSILFVITTGYFAAILPAFIIHNTSSGYDDNGYRSFRKYFKLFVFLFVLAVLLPNKETIIEMYVASILTQENILIGKEVAINTIKEIIEALNINNTGL